MSKTEPTDAGQQDNEGEELSFESEIVLIPDVKEPNFLEPPLQEIGRFLNGIPEPGINYAEGVELPKTVVDFKGTKPFEARYVCYTYTTYGKVIEKMTAARWRTPSLEESLLFAAKDKNFQFLVCLDIGRKARFCIDSRWGENYKIIPPQDYEKDIDFEQEAVSDTELLFVKEK